MVISGITFNYFYISHRYIVAWIIYYNNKMKDLVILFGVGLMTIKYW